MNAKKPTKRKTSQDPAAQRTLLLVLLLSFTICAGILAFKLNPGIVPDENAHFIFAKHYASTWGIPSRWCQSTRGVINSGGLGRCPLGNWSASTSSRGGVSRCLAP